MKYQLERAFHLDLICAVRHKNLSNQLISLISSEIMNSLPYQYENLDVDKQKEKYEYLTDILENYSAFYIVSAQHSS